MAETIRIEIPITVDNETDSELAKVVKNLNKMSDAANKTNSSVKKANDTVSKFDKTAEKTQKSLASWAKEKYEILLEAKDKVGPVLTTLGSNLKSFAGKTWSFTMKAVDLATAPIRGIINLLKNPILQVGAVLGISFSLKDTVDTYSDFEATMSKVQALSDATEGQLEQLTEKAIEMGSKTKYSGTESAEAFTYMAQAGWEVNDMIEGIGGVMSLAAADGQDLATTTDIVSSALTAFGLSASESARFADVLAVASSATQTDVQELGEAFKYVAPLAGTLKYSIEDVALALGLMSNNGVSSSMAGTSLKASLANLANPTKKMKTAMEEYGISLTDSEGNMKSLKDLMDNMRSSLGGLSEAEQTSAAAVMFGKEAMSGMLAIVNTTDEDYAKLTEQILNSEGAADRMAETMQDNLAGAFEQVGGAVENVQLKLVGRLEPYLLSLANWLTTNMPELEDLIDEVFDTIDVRVAKIKKRFTDLMATDEWQNADAFGKIKIAWDEMIAEPFSEWWNSTGKAKIADVAEDIGQGIGSGLKFGLLALLGIEVSDTIDEGASIGRSFAAGFTDGFDFDLIKEKLGEGFKNLFSDAAKLLPGGESADLSSVISAVILSKLASPAISLGKGLFSTGKALFGRQESLGGASLVGTMLGSAATGKGLLGLGSMTAINLGAGNLAGGASLSAGALSALGLGAVGGGVIGGATLVSGGIDAYKAIKSDNADEAKAYGTSAGLKVGGVAAGAATGALIGSVVPGLGTAVGALIGAGIGGIGGYLAGNKVKDNYAEDVEEAQKQAELAQKAFETTGLSIDEVKFKNEALNEALNDSEVTAQEFAVMMQEDVANTMKEAFGDVDLSLEEIQSLAEEITFDGMKDGVTEFASAVNDADTSLATLKDSVTALKKENWKVSLGMELDETEQDDYKKAIDTFVDSATEYIDNNHYQATVALSLLSGDSADTSGLDNMYNSMKTQIDDISQRLSDELEIALSDGVISFDESAELTNLQDQITEITNKLSEAQEEASLEALQVKYTGAELTPDSFTQLQSELQTQMQEFESNYDEALTVSLTNLKLQLSEGAISQEEYDAAAQELKDNYSLQISDMSARIESFNLETIAEAWGTQLDGILPDIEGTTAEKLSTAMNNALLSNPNPTEWTQEQVKEWFGLDSLASSDASAFESIYSELVATASAVPEDTKEQIVEGFRSALPTKDELLEGIDWDSLTWEAKEEMMNALIPGSDSGQYIVSSGSTWDAGALLSESANFDTLKENLSEQLANALQESTDPEAVQSWLAEYYTSATETAAADIDFIGPYSQAIYDQLGSMDLSDADWESVKESLSSGIVTAIEGADMESVQAALDVIKGKVDTSASSTFSAGYDVTMPLNVTFKYNVTNPTIPSSLLPSGTTSVTKHATGGYVGSPELALLAEEGYGEYVIPTNPSRRSRALDIYRQAGAALGVSAYAEGGLTGGANSAVSLSGYDLLTEAISNAPTGYNAATSDTNEGGTSGVEPVSVTGTQEVAGQNIQVSVQMSPEFVISGSDGADEDSIMQIIRKNMKSMADELGGEIAEKLEAVFSNMPLKEA